MEKISTIGLDLAKNVFQVHGNDVQGKMLVRRQLRRAEMLSFFAKLAPCLVGMEACATAHYWGRELIKLGHTVKLMPLAYVKPYVKRGKTDAADAAAIAEAVTRPTMRFVAVKTVDQQAILMLHKVRDLLVRQRTMLINALRGHLAEFGIVAIRGPAGIKAAIEELHLMQNSLPALARVALHRLIDRLEAVGAEIRKAEKEILAWCRDDAVSRRLMTIPGIGPISASAIAAAVPDASLFRSGRQLRRGSASRHAPIAAAAKNGLEGSASRVTATSAVSSSRARLPSSGWRARATPARYGQPGCSTANRPGLSLSHWPIKPPGSPGLCSHAVSLIERLPHNRILVAGSTTSAPGM